MADNIFKTLRLEHTEEIVKRGAGKSIEVKRPYSQTKLARELKIHRDSVENAESGMPPSLSTVEAYHKYFEIPYSTLLGETDIKDVKNLHINKELGLSDDCIRTIKDLPPIAHAMLNAFLSKEGNTTLFFLNLADITYSLTELLKQNGNNKSDPNYLEIEKQAQQLFIRYMKTITFRDLKKVLLQSEREATLIQEAGEADRFFEK